MILEPPHALSCSFSHSWETLLLAKIKIKEWQRERRKDRKNEAETGFEKKGGRGEILREMAWERKKFQMLFLLLLYIWKLDSFQLETSFYVKSFKSNLYLGLNYPDKISSSSYRWNSLFNKKAKSCDESKANRLPPELKQEDWLPALSLFQCLWLWLLRSCLVVLMWSIRGNKSLHRWIVSDPLSHPGGVQPPPLPTPPVPKLVWNQSVGFFYKKKRKNRRGTQYGVVGQN